MDNFSFLLSGDSLMQWFWCLLLNNTPIPVRVVVLSQFGQGHYYIYPNQNQWVQWYPGQKSLTAFDLNNGQILTTHGIVVNGPMQYTVTGQGPQGPYGQGSYGQGSYSWQEAPTAMPPPSGGGPGASE